MEENILLRAILVIGKEELLWYFVYETKIVDRFGLDVSKRLVEV